MKNNKKIPEEAAKQNIEAKFMSFTTPTDEGIHSPSEELIQKFTEGTKLPENDQIFDLEDLAPEIAEKMNLPEKEVRFVLRAFNKELFKALTYGSVVKINGFGTFYPGSKKRKRTTKRQPQKTRTENSGVVFMAAKEFIEKMNCLYVESLKKRDKFVESQN